MTPLASALRLASYGPSVGARGWQAPSPTGSASAIPGAVARGGRSEASPSRTSRPIPGLHHLQFPRLLASRRAATTGA